MAVHAFDGHLLMLINSYNIMKTNRKDAAIVVLAYGRPPNIFDHQLQADITRPLPRDAIPDSASPNGRSSAAPIEVASF